MLGQLTTRACLTDQNRPTSRRSVFAAVVSAPRRVYPRKDGELIMLQSSLASGDKANSSGRRSWVRSMIPYLRLVSIFLHRITISRTSKPVLVKYRNPTTKIASRSFESSSFFVTGSCSRAKSTTGTDENVAAIPPMILCSM